MFRWDFTLSHVELIDSYDAYASDQSEDALHLEMWKW